MNRASLPIALLALVLAARVAAQEVQGWRTPSGELYFGSAPPPGSTRIDSVRTRPTRQPTAPEATVAPRFTATAKPTATPRPTVTPPDTAHPPAIAPPTPLPPRKLPIATPRAAEVPRTETSPRIPSTSQSETACGDIVAIRDTRPTIDSDADRVVVSGEILVTTRTVKNLVVCLGGSCASVADGKALAEGETARFRVAAAGNRPNALRVECSIIGPR